MNIQPGDFLLDPLSRKQLEVLEVVPEESGLYITVGTSRSIPDTNDVYWIKSHFSTINQLKVSGLVLRLKHLVGEKRLWAFEATTATDKYYDHHKRF